MKIKTSQKLQYIQKKSFPKSEKVVLEEREGGSEANWSLRSH